MTRSAVRAGLVSLALLFLLWEAHGAARWIADAGGPGRAIRHLWMQLHGDRMLVVAFSDLVLIAGIVLVALWVDAMRRGVRPLRRALLVAAFIAFGSPVVLCYIAWRLADTDSSRAAASRPGSA